MDYECLVGKLVIIVGVVYVLLVNWLVEPRNILVAAKPRMARETDLETLLYLQSVLDDARLRLSESDFQPKLHGYPVTECSQFNSSLNEANLEIGQLLGMFAGAESGPWQQNGSPNFFGVPSMSLHEQTDQLRAMQASRAHEALGKTISFYLACISRLAQIGSTAALSNLLPFSLEMSTMSITSEEVLTPDDPVL